MSPQTIQKLNENLPEIREFRAFLAAEADKLRDISTLKTDDRAAVDIAITVQARQCAIEIIANILAPLIGEDIHKGIDMKEYVV